MPIIFLEGLFLLILIAITIFIIFNEKLLTSVIVFSGFSFFAMLMYLIVGAADVAFTEAVIGSISTVYFIVAIRSVAKGNKKDSQGGDGQ